MEVLSAERCEQELGIEVTARTFALRVEGDAMRYRHICHGDYVICEHGRIPRHGDIVAALIENISTLRTYVLQDRQMSLRDAGGSPLPADEVVVQGVVIRIIRRCE